MADLTRAEELVQTIDRDAAFRAEVEAAPTVAAKRHLIDARGFQDVGFEDMKAYVESQGGKLVAQDGGRELTDQELAAVAGGLTAGESVMVAGMVSTAVGFASIAAGAAA